MRNTIEDDSTTGTLILLLLKLYRDPKINNIPLPCVTLSNVGQDKKRDQTLISGRYIIRIMIGKTVTKGDKNSISGGETNLPSSKRLEISYPEHHGFRDRPSGSPWPPPCFSNHFQREPYDM